MPPCPPAYALARIHSLSRGASLVDEVLMIAAQERVRTAQVAAIGGVDRLTLAYFNREKKKYEEHVYDEYLEVVSMLGDITLKDGKPFLHIHGTFGRRDMSVVGGHVVSASVFPLLEVVITPTKNTAFRRFDDDIGVNVIFKT
jgi:hypothetical protein